MSDNILDTLLIKDGKIYLKEFHLDRTYEAYQFLNLNISKDQLAKIYDTIEKQYENQSLRVIFSKTLPLNYSVDVRPVESINPVVRLSLFKLSEDFMKSSYKWEDRRNWVKLYEQRPQHTDDVLLLTPDGFIRETTRFNFFAYCSEKNVYFTPELSTGCINGAFRRYALKNRINDTPVVEKNLKAEEITLHDLYVANSVRGLLKATLET